MTTNERLRILTVGDGDLSYSLALRRCFGEQIELTATTLLSETELTATYTRAPAILAELRERGVDVRFGVDATALALGPADLIIFSFPHLGLTDLSDEALAARRHGVLLAHFFASAAPLLADGGRVHLTLSGNHHELARRGARRAQRAARRSRGAAVAETFGELCAAPAAEVGVKRRYRNGALGSKPASALWTSTDGARRCRDARRQRDRARADARAGARERRRRRYRCAICGEVLRPEELRARGDACRHRVAAPARCSGGAAGGACRQAGTAGAAAEARRRRRGGAAAAAADAAAPAG